MRAVWRTLADHRDLRFLLGAGVVSLTGDWILGIGLAYQIYVITGSTLASALVLLAAYVPQILLGSVAGVFVDRWNRKRTMVGANLLLALGLVPLLLVDSTSRVWIVYVVVAWEGVVESFFSPAEQAMIPNVVSDDRLVAANALNGQNRDVARLVGSALGGLLAAAGGLTAVTVVDIGSFLFAAVLVSLLQTSGQAPTSMPAGVEAVPAVPTGAVEQLAEFGQPVETYLTGSTPSAADRSPERVALARFHELRGEWADGLRRAGTDRVLRLLLLFALITSTGEGIMGTLFAPFVRDVLHGSSAAFGVVAAVQAIGGIGGGLVAASIGHRVSAALLFGWGAVAFGLVDLLMFLYPLGWVAVWPAAVCMVVVGLPGALTIAGFMTLFQRSTEDSYRGRVFGAIGVAQGVAAVIGTVAAGFLGQTVGIVPIIALQGGGYVIAGIVMLLGLRGHVAAGQAAPA